MSAPHMAKITLRVPAKLLEEVRILAALSRASVPALLLPVVEQYVKLQRRPNE